MGGGFQVGRFFSPYILSGAGSESEILGQAGHVNAKDVATFALLSAESFTGWLTHM